MTIKVALVSDERLDAVDVARGADGLPYTWNGWISPLFTKEQAQTALEEITKGVESDDEYRIEWRWDGDVLVLREGFHEEDGPFETREKPNKDGLYSFGDSWTWYICDEDQDRVWTRDGTTALYLVRDLQVAEHLSEETLAFTCTLHRNGKRVATVKNHGRGGSHLYTWEPGVVGDEIAKEATKFVRKDTSKRSIFFEGFAGSDYIHLDQLVNEAQFRLEMRDLGHKEHGTPVWWMEPDGTQIVEVTNDDPREFVKALKEGCVSEIFYFNAKPIVVVNLED